MVDRALENVCDLSLKLTFLFLLLWSLPNTIDVYIFEKKRKLDFSFSFVSVYFFPEELRTLFEDTILGCNKDRTGEDQGKKSEGNKIIDRKTTVRNSRFPSCNYSDAAINIFLSEVHTFTVKTNNTDVFLSSLVTEKTQNLSCVSY